MKKNFRYIIDIVLILVISSILFNSCNRERVESNYSSEVELIYKTINASGKDILLTKSEIEEQIKKSHRVVHRPIINNEAEFECGTVLLDTEQLLTYRFDLPIPDEIVIPVVFHVMHSNGIGNISTEQIMSGLDRLNNDFSESNFTFCLATEDPNGNPSDGIIRINVNEFYPDYQSVYITGANDNCVNSPSALFHEDLESLSYWSKSHAMNVYIYPQINCGDGTGGVFIGNINSSTSVERVMIRFDRIGSVPNIFNGQVLSYNEIWGGVFTHEVGHYFNLRHIWGQLLRPNLDCGNVTENPFTCGGGGAFDFVCDTPPTSGPRNNNCTVGQSCPDGLVGNYMDYDINCYNHFTEGQIDRMHESIFTPGRAALINSTACTLPSCPWDLDGDGIVAIGDLLILLSQWGSPYTINDLLTILSEFGLDCN